MKGFAIAVIAGAAVGGAGVVFGFWWLTFPVGILVGAGLPRTRYAVPAGALAGLLSWSLPLAWGAVRYGLGPAADSLAAIMGFTGLSTVPVILTCLVGLLLGLVGAWLGSAVRALAGDQPAISR